MGTPLDPQYFVGVTHPRFILNSAFDSPMDARIQAKVKSLCYPGTVYEVIFMQPNDVPMSVGAYRDGKGTASRLPKV